MYASRLLHLSDELQKLPASKFDMKQWYRFDDYPNYGFRGRRPALTKIEEVRTCCALGFATFLPEFNRAGLRPGIGPFGTHMPYYKGLVAEAAAREFFELSVSEALIAFGASSPWPHSPKRAATRIRKLVHHE